MSIFVRFRPGAWNEHGQKWTFMDMKNGGNLAARHRPTP
jgi:hypothetical protein